MGEGNQNATNIQVAVRIRPFLPFEAGSKSCIEVLQEDAQAASSPAVQEGSSLPSSQGTSVRIGSSSSRGQTFTFDKCFSGAATQVEVYQTCVLPLLLSCLEGYNATTLAYGQTGAGKTYTTMGPATSAAFFANREEHSQENEAVGILPRALRDLFSKLEERRNGGEHEYQVKLQFLELYGEEIRDLLAPSLSSQKIVIRDAAGDAEALGAVEVAVQSAQEAMVCLTRGMLRRVTGATAMNAESSRSHAMMSVIVDQARAAQHVRSKFNFVDLAGSERQKRTNAKGQRLKEGININKGLLVLGNVISALASGDNKFVPFRDSKLTRLLRGSLGGNHKTLMIACASPSHKNVEESLNCLRYANRAKNIQNTAIVNIDPHSKLVLSLRNQLQSLAAELLRVANGGTLQDSAYDSLAVLAKGGKDSITFSHESSNQSNQSTHSQLLEQLEQTKAALQATQQDLFDTNEQLEAIVKERDSLKQFTDEIQRQTPTPAKLKTPSKAMGMEKGESIQEILTNLSKVIIHDNTDDNHKNNPDNNTHDDNPDNTPDDDNPDDDNPDNNPDESPIDSHDKQNGLNEKEYSNHENNDTNEKLLTANTKIDELSSELQSLRLSLDHSNTQLQSKTHELETAHTQIQTLQQRLRDTPDIDEETIHFIIQQISSYERIYDDDSVESDTIQPFPPKQDQLSTFASAMFSTGKFLVDRELFQDSIPCFEVVLEIRRELYGWDDPLVGDALHMEGFVRSKMGDYDRALMLLWDALRIRKIASEPLKISATLRLLADLHFSKEENMHAALFYEECARHLKEHDLRDPHLPLVLIDLARTKDRLGEYAESMNFFEEALTLYEHTLESDDDRIASLQYEMGVLAFQMGERERGESCFRHFIRIRKSKGSNLDEGVANALFVLGSLHWATKKRDMAHDCWVEALDIFKGLGRTDEDPYVKSLKEKIARAQRKPTARGGFIQRMMDK